ncbi:UNVERIFIED_CONTAM: Filamin/ABP280 repeat-containing protein [Hammondia hammondi]|eukprot:XP_008882524.1 Filamin/ABP280 repeat-containing protein [Hammondia hammondi]
MEAGRPLSLGAAPPGLLGPRQRPSSFLLARTSPVHLVPPSPSSSSVSSLYCEQEKRAVAYEGSCDDDREDARVSVDSGGTGTDDEGETDEEFSSNRRRISTFQRITNMRHRSCPPVLHSPLSDVIVEDELISDGAASQPRHVYFDPSSSDESSPKNSESAASHEPGNDSSDENPGSHARWRHACRAGSAFSWRSSSSSDCSSAASFSPSGSSTSESSTLSCATQKPFDLHAQSPGGVSRRLVESAVSRPSKALPLPLPAASRPPVEIARPGCMKKPSSSSACLSSPFSGDHVASSLGPPPGLRSAASSTSLACMQIPDFRSETRRLRVRFAETAAHGSGAEETDKRTPHMSPKESLKSPPNSPLQSPPQSPLQSPPKSTSESPPQSPSQSPPQSPLQSPPQSPLESPSQPPSGGRKQESNEETNERPEDVGRPMSLKKSEAPAVRASDGQTASLVELPVENQGVMGSKSEPLMGQEGSSMSPKTTGSFSAEARSRSGRQGLASGPRLVSGKSVQSMRSMKSTASISAKISGAKRPEVGQPLRKITGAPVETEPPLAAGAWPSTKKDKPGSTAASSGSVSPDPSSAKSTSGDIKDTPEAIMTAKDLINDRSENDRTNADGDESPQSPKTPVDLTTGHAEADGTRIRPDGADESAEDRENLPKTQRPRTAEGDAEVREERERAAAKRKRHEKHLLSTQAALRLRIASITNLQTSGVVPKRGGYPLPQRARGGVSGANGAYGLAPCFTICTVAWFPEEDPLEILGFTQGASWLPGWGLRVSSAVNTRPSARPGAISLDEAEVQQELTVPISVVENSWQQRMLALELGSNFPLQAPEATPASTGTSGKQSMKAMMKRLSQAFNLWPFLLVSVIQIHPKLSHSLALGNSPFRLAPVGTQPQNAIGPPQRVRYPTKSPVTVVGTAILPLKEIHEGSGVLVDRHQLLFMDIDKAPPVAVHSDGSLTYLQACRLFRHDVIREMIATYRESLKRLEPVSLLSVIEAYSGRLSPVGEIFVTLNQLRPLMIDWGPVLGRRWFRPDARMAGDVGDRKGSRGKPAHTRRLKDSGDNLQGEKNAPAGSYPAAHAVWIEIRKVVNVPIYGLTFRQICDAELSVVAMWEAERACAAILRRKSRKITAVTRCEVQPLNFSAIERMSGSEDSLLSCYIRGQVCLPVYPGLDPSVVLYLCLNGQIYATLASPLNLAAFSPECGLGGHQELEKKEGRMQLRSGKSGHGPLSGQGQAGRWRLPVSSRTPSENGDADSSLSATDEDDGSEKSDPGSVEDTKHASPFRAYKLRSFIPEGPQGDAHGFAYRLYCGQIELRVFPCPANGLFMTAAEFAKLNIEGRSSSGRSMQLWPESPNEYGAPMIGPFGKWTAFADDFEARAGLESLEGGVEEVEEAPGSPVGSRPVCAFFSPAPSHLQPLPGTPEELRSDSDVASALSDAEAAPNPLSRHSPVESMSPGQAAHRGAAREGLRAVPRGAGPVDAQMCVAEGANLTIGHVGEWNVFEVRARNRRGEEVADADGAVALCFSPLGEPQYSFVADPTSSLSVDAYRMDTMLIGGGRVGVITKTELTSLTPEWAVEKTKGDCVYRVKYRHTRPGFVLMHVTYEGLEIAGSPFEVHFIRGKAVAEACRVIGQGAKTCFASPSPHLQLPYVNAEEARALIDHREREEAWKTGVEGKRESPKPAVLNNYVNQFVVAVCDEMGNRVSIGGHRVSVRGSQGAKILQVVDEGRGTYRVDYAVYLPKTPLQQIDVGLLEKIDSYAWITQAQPDAFVPGIAEAYEHIESLELPVHTEAKIEVLLNEQPIFGCPFKVRICNFVEVFNAYAELDRRSLLGQQVCAFERVLEEGNYEEATSLLWKVQDMADEKQLKEEVVTVLENLVRKQLEREDAKKREAEEGGCTYLLEETSKDREEKRRREVEEIRSQWEDIHLLRELLLRLNKNCTDRESLVHRFTLSMVGRLQLTEMCNLRILAEHHNMQRLQQENLMPLAEVLQAQYISLFRQMTQEIVALVKDVEDNKFQNLEALLQAYRRIGVQLRRLHRYQLADQMDQIIECVVEEIELQRLASIARAKQEKIQEIENEIAAKEQALEAEKKKYEEHAKTFQPLDMDEVRALITTRRQAGVQTEDALSLREGIFGPLIVARATGQHVPKASIVVTAVKKEWRSCNVYDIHTTIKRLLKNCPRLKHCLKEVFLHYAKVSEANVSDLQSDGLPVGLPQLSFLRFCNDARVDEHLLADRTELQDLFEKFSVEPDTGRIRADGFLRVIPVFLWLPCLRELAYLDLLHVMCREALEKGEAPRVALRRAHPSRLTAFHFFCRARFLPLYDLLYNNDDFRISTSVVMETAAGDLLSTSAQSRESNTKHSIWTYAHEQLPGDVFSMLKLEPIEHLFVFYSELSAQPALGRARAEATFPTASKGPVGSEKKGEAAEPKLPPRGSPKGQEHARPKPKAQATARRFVAQTSLEETGAEHVSTRAWVSLGVLIQMWREFSVIPGFIDCDAAASIARVAIGGSRGKKNAAYKDADSQNPSDETSGPNAKGSASEEPEFRRLLSMPEIQGDTRRGPNGKLRKAAPSLEAEEGRLYFPNFVEAVVNTVCECTARALVQEGDSSVPPGSREATSAEIKKKAFFLLHLFGINDVSRILLLTRRPLREAIRTPAKDETQNSGVPNAPPGT